MGKAGEHYCFRHSHCTLCSLCRCCRVNTTHMQKVSSAPVKNCVHSLTDTQCGFADTYWKYEGHMIHSTQERENCLHRLVQNAVLEFYQQN